MMDTIDTVQMLERIVYGCVYKSCVTDDHIPGDQLWAACVAINSTVEQSSIQQHISGDKTSLEGVCITGKNVNTKQCALLFQIDPISEQHVNTQIVIYGTVLIM